MKKFIVILYLISLPLNANSGERDFERAANSIDAVIDAKFVSSSSFFMVVRNIRGGSKKFWKQMGEQMCRGRSNFGISNKAFGITIFNSNKKKVAKVYCR
tara:strand:+ start:113 stop:412 length:300 start_codon:yes stop_codon:yes gene_type:complete